VLLQACLNGPRDRREHGALPVTTEELAADARACVRGSAAAFHVHPRGPDGRESLAGAVVDRTVAAVRDASARPVGVGTGAWVEPDSERRSSLVSTWTEPDYASVNLSERGADRVMRALLERGIGIEAGVWSVEDAERLAETGFAARLTRVLVEMVDGDPGAEETAREVDSALDRLGIDAPRLHHGQDESAWPVLRQAVSLGRDLRIGLEDCLFLPTGEIAPDNAALVRAAREVMSGYDEAAKR
jgi:uncharacterized protein (DUF849 family)